MKYSNTSLFALIAILFNSTFAYSQVQSSTARIDPDRAAGVTVVKPASKVVTPDAIQREMREALDLIKKNYGGSKTIDYEEVVKSSIDSMLHALDPHSNYFDAKEFEQFKTDQSSKYFGIGATIGDLRDSAGNVLATYIKATFDGAPAHRAGLRYGDKIIEVNGTTMLGKPFNEVRDFLRGPQGTKAKIVVEKLATGQRETVDIVRDAVPQPSIGEVYMIRPGVGYMAMRLGFNQTTYQEFVKGMRELKAAGMQQLVIDLRDNGGGLVNQALRVANTFLSDGQTIFIQKGRFEGATELVPAQNRNPDRSPIVILVNSNTASASEILAGALQDHDRALIVGENTFGKGLVTNPFVLEGGSMLLLTIAKFLTPSGRLIQRDYSHTGLYDYLYKGRAGYDSEEADTMKAKGEESKTDSGRSVYGGGGIDPDVAVKARTIPIERVRVQQKIASPIFAFALDAVRGRLKGYEDLKVDRPIAFGYNLKDNDYRVTAPIFSEFKKYAVEVYKINPALIDQEKEFIERALRTELVTAAYGAQTSYQVFNEYDDQLLKAIDLLPEAKQLAMQSDRMRTIGRSPGN